jgi:hypothetical protein
MRRIVFISLLVLICAPTVLAAPPTIGGCQIFPPNNPWNTDISGAAVHPNSKNYIKYINAHGGDFVHPDFGGEPEDHYGIPWIEVTSAQATVPVSFDYDDESDPGPYPIPDDAPIEGGSDADGDRHILIVETTNCVLYELYYAWPNDVGGDVVSWDAGSGAIYDLNSNALRPEGWTSADAAGLPILPGLANCDQANSGTIDHALRFTVSSTQRAFIYPATHFASSVTDTNAPPMGLRLRLKANYDTSGLTGQALAIANALKKYGMILADNGSNWYISGEENAACWDDDQLNALKSIPGKAFEVIVSPPPPSDTAGDLIANGGFEAGLPKGKQPSYWTLSVHKDVRRCDSDSAAVAYAGRCAFVFSGNAAGYADRIQQVVNLNGLAPFSALNFNGYAAAAAAVAGGKLKVKLIYSDPANNRSFSVPFPTGTSGYQPMQFILDDTDIVYLTKVKLKFMYRGTSGKVWLDGLSLVANSGARTLPVPVPPAAG